jgi:hypothetical protein
MFNAVLLVYRYGKRLISTDLFICVYLAVVVLVKLDGSM